MMTNKTAPPPTGTSRSFLKKTATHALSNPMLAVLLVLAIIAAIAYPGFLDPTNLQNMLVQNAPLALVSVGMTYVIITGAFDLSVGAIFALSAVIFASLDGAIPVTIAVGVAILVGTAAGGANAFLVTGWRLNPFVATLGTASVFTGIAAAYAASKGTLLLESPAFLGVSNTPLLGIELAIWLSILAFVIFGFVLAKTPYGRMLYAVGGNNEAARLSGIRVNVVRGSTFLIVGALSALAGVLLTSQVALAQPSFGASLALDAIAVVVIGGTSLIGGEGAMWRSVVGLLILAIVNNLFQSLALDPALQQILKGGIVIVAVALDAWMRSTRN